MNQPQVCDRCLADKLKAIHAGFSDVPIDVLAGVAGEWRRARGFDPVGRIICPARHDHE
jgi:hypothetical protein